MSIALSYSRLSTYENCPRKFKSQYITKTYPDDSDNPHFVRGSKIHKQLEEYVIAMGAAADTFAEMPKLSPESQNAVKMIESIFNSYSQIYTEQQIAVNKDLEQISWFSKDAYYRVIYDLVALNGNEALLVDWKTGKVRDYDNKPTGQLHLAAAIMFAIKPHLQKITTAYVFVEHKHTISKVFTRDMFDEMIPHFHEAYDTVNADKEFTPKVNKYCYFCHINPEECEFKK